MTKLMRRIKELELRQAEVTRQIDELLKRLEIMEREWEEEMSKDLAAIFDMEDDDEAFSPDSEDGASDDG